MTEGSAMQGAIAEGSTPSLGTNLHKSNLLFALRTACRDLRDVH